MFVVSRDIRVYVNGCEREAFSSLPKNCVGFHRRGARRTALLMLPLMTEAGLGLFEAVKESYRMSVSGSIADQVVVVVVFLGLLIAGSSVFVGSLFTQPLATIFLLSVYEEKRGPQGS